MTEKEVKKDEDFKDGDEPEKDEESQNLVKLKYPMAVPFIISNEFCERFNFYGMKAILVLYLTRKLMYDGDTATILYHTFNTMVYFFCLLGAIIADSWWGKFKTILILSIVYAIGSSTVAITAIELLNLPARTLTIIGLFLIALGSGGIKPCVAAFGGEQFRLPQQAAQLATFFSFFYFSINAGSLLSTSVTPIMREDVECFEKDDCYSLAFGVPAVLMIVSIIIFIFGKPLYRMVDPSGNMFVKVCSCIGNAISTRSKEKKTETEPREHWLNYAENKFGKKLVMETKILLNVLVLYIPLPLFWALFDQQGSRWTLQATLMNGDIGFMTIKPDQMQVINPLLILIFIPLYEVLFYPLLRYVGIRRPLQKLAMGGVLAGVAFVLSAFVEISLRPTYAVLPASDQAQLRIFNGMNCQYNIQQNIPDLPDFTVDALNYYQNREQKMEMDSANYNFIFTTSNPNCPNNVAKTVTLRAGEATTIFLRWNGAQLDVFDYIDNVEKSIDSLPVVRVLANTLTHRTIILLDKDNRNQFEGNRSTTQQQDVRASTYDIMVDGTKVGTEDLRLGGVYTLIVQERTAGSFFINLHTISDPNTVHMLWLLPQYIVMTLGEVMFSITGLQFSFTQAPESMKSVLQGFWMLTVAFGNLIVVAVTGAKFFDDQTYEFFLFAGLMFVDMIVFIWLAIRYTAIPLSELDRIDEELKNENSEKKSALEFPGTSNGKSDDKME